MKFKIAQTELMDGEKVWDLMLFSNGTDPKTKERKCIFTCHSHINAQELFKGIERLIKKHTIETLEVHPCFKRQHPLNGTE